MSKRVNQTQGDEMSKFSEYAKKLTSAVLALSVLAGCVSNPALQQDTDTPTAAGGKKIDLSNLKAILAADEDFYVFPATNASGKPVKLYIRTKDGDAYRPIALDKPENTQKVFLQPGQIQSKTPVNTPYTTVICYGKNQNICAPRAYTADADSYKPNRVVGLQSMNYVQAEGGKFGLDFKSSFKILQEGKIGQKTSRRDGTYIYNMYCDGEKSGETIVSCDQTGQPRIDFRGPNGPISQSQLPPGVPSPSSGECVMLSESAVLNGGVSTKTGKSRGLILRSTVDQNGKHHLSPVVRTGAVGPDSIMEQINASRPSMGICNKERFELILR
ncbi:MAG: hypothetical protein IPI58_05130 [Alphaproteobacteria bacterium]|nr:MAG: hypothetical protein IPI58_05130 [Alphaproteobacteria bacterium]